jgi:hypothetical protein
MADAHPASRKGVVENSSAPTVMKVAEWRSERAAAFQLLHRAYLQAGLTFENEMQMRVTKFHLVDTTDLLVAKRNADVEFTATLVRDGQLGLPVESLFADEVAAMRSAGMKLAEVSCVASGVGEDKRQRFETLVKMIGLTIHAARRRGVGRLLLAVHPRHARLYQRLFGCVPCSEVKQYAAVQGNPALLCAHDFAELDRRRYPLYNQIYGDYYRPWQLDGTRMTDEEIEFFQRAVHHHADDLVPMAA